MPLFAANARFKYFTAIAASLSAPTVSDDLYHFIASLLWLGIA
jgi:hypothetical protein